MLNFSLSHLLSINLFSYIFRRQAKVPSILCICHHIEFFIKTKKCLIANYTVVVLTSSGHWVTTVRGLHKNCELFNFFFKSCYVAVVWLINKTEKSFNLTFDVQYIRVVSIVNKLHFSLYSNRKFLAFCKVFRYTMCIQIKYYPPPLQPMTSYVY